ncbi:MAG TPA: hypothetical protein VG318_05995 [Actinomycetota bacterium]|nr:hypothetical protein [Actinomycetota bacterium]
MNERKNRTKARIAAAVLTLGATLGAAAPAHAEPIPICESLPVTTPGSTISIAGQTHRVQSISNVRICFSYADLQAPYVNLAPDVMCSTCVELWAFAYADIGPIQVSWDADGVTRAERIDPPSVSSPANGLCVAAVGIPASPEPGCLISIGLDNLP